MSTAPEALLARAFHRDPFLSWAEPVEERRFRTLSTMFRRMLDLSIGVGGHLHEPGVGSVDWRGMEHAHAGWGLVLRSGLWRLVTELPPGVVWRLSQHEDEAMTHVLKHLGREDVYLCTLGVSPDRKGQGHGSRLLMTALDRLSGDWSRVVLRTENRANVPFYERHGFVCAESFVAKSSGLRVWVFARDLREPHVTTRALPGSR